jgi:hypothetical protein
MAYDANEPLTLADQLALLARTMPEDEARARLDKLFRLRGKSIYAPKYAVSYEDAKIDWATGRVTLRRLPRQPFTPTLTAAEHFALFPQSVSNKTTELPPDDVSAVHPINDALAATSKNSDPVVPTASYSDVKSIVKKHGEGTERELLTVVREALSNKHVPRARIRQARDELFGKPGRVGRPKSGK